MHLAPEGSGCAIASGPAFPRWSKRGREPGRNAFDTFAMNAIIFDVNIEAIDIIHINSIKNQTKYSLWEEMNDMVEDNSCMLYKETCKAKVSLSYLSLAFIKK